MSRPERHSADARQYAATHERLLMGKRVLVIGTNIERQPLRAYVSLHKTYVPCQPPLGRGGISRPVFPQRSRP